MSTSFEKYPFLKALGLSEDNLGLFNQHGWGGSGEFIESVTPVDGSLVARVKECTLEEYNESVVGSEAAFLEWRKVPAPKRGEIIRQIGDALREKLTELGALVTLEVGKIKGEGIGEVQEFIDICDLAVGLSRTYNGQVFQSERPGHFMMEVWNPLGPCGVISAFNFPCAVFGWNAAIALVTGNTVLWKGAPSTPLTSVAIVKICAEVFKKNDLPANIISLVQGPAEVVGEAMINDKRLPLISFTGSTKVGRHVNVKVAERFGRALLELGGNNAVLVHEDADLDAAFNSVLFGAVGTAGQRCTSIRRLFLHESIYDKFVERLVAAYAKVNIGNPLEDKTLMGPLHSQMSVDNYMNAVNTAVSQGGKLLYGGEKLDGFYVKPAIIEATADLAMAKEETFGPLLYVFKYSTLEEAIAANNSVAQGLSSSLFTMGQQNVFKWTGPEGSDCGIVNVNMSSSGAEIGGAFGGNKETGWGRESGSDSWKQYARRQTCSINYALENVLAQGIKFELE